MDDVKEIEKELFEADSNLYPVAPAGVKASIDLSANDGALSCVDYIYKKAYEALLTLDDFADFSLSEDPQNWKHTGRPKRVIFDNGLLLEHLEKDSGGNLTPLGQLIEATRDTHNGFWYRDTLSTVVYVNQILPVHEAIIAPYLDNGIYVEDKAV